MKNRFIYTFVLLGLVASMGLGSCNITKRYKSPEVVTENLYRDVQQDSSASIASLHWSDYFGDPYLQSLIEQGLANNFDMLIVMQRIEQAQAALKMARAAYYPTLGVMGQSTHTRLSMNTDNSSADFGANKFLEYGTTENRLALSTSWELDVWGKLSRQKKAKYAQYLNSIEGRNLVQTNLVSGIATMYYSLLSLDEQLSISVRAVELLKETVVTMEAMKQAGLLNGAAVEQTKAALYGAQVNIPALEAAIKQMENSICLTIGLNPGSVERGSFADQGVASYFAVGTAAQMLANRPDVRSAELAFRSAFELTNSARASLYPSISLSSGMFGYVGLVDSFFDPKNIALILVGNLSQPIFAKKQLTTQLKVAKAEQEVALLDFKKAVLTAGIEVSDIMNNYESSLRKNEFRSQQVESLDRSVEYTQLLLKAGEANYLEVITAEQDLLQAQLGQVNDKLEQLQLSASLYKALGGGIYR